MEWPDIPQGGLRRARPLVILIAYSEDRCKKYGLTHSTFYLMREGCCPTAQYVESSPFMIPVDITDTGFGRVMLGKLSYVTKSS